MAIDRSTDAAPIPATGYRWLARGDLNAFFALAADNLADIVILAALLTNVYQLPRDVVLYRMVPGTAAGVLLGNLLYGWLAWRLARREGRSDVCAMPLGINTPTVFAMVFVVIGPAYAATHDAMYAWKVGMAVTVIVGLFKMLLAPLGEAVRRAVPRAGLLGSLGGAGVTLIACLPLLNAIRNPIVGLVTLVLVLATLSGRLRLPGNLPGAFAAVLIGTAADALLQRIGYASPLLPPGAVADGALHFSSLLPTLAFAEVFADALGYLPAVLPFSLGAVVGGIDNTESAAAAGDGYNANHIVLTQGICTVVTGVCGGVVENTSYIGHPAYKEMGARAGYAVGTGLFVGVSAMLGFFPFLVDRVPVAAVAPLLIFVGLQIGAQAFHATPARHGMAVALAMLPTLGLLLLMQADSWLAATGVTAAELRDESALAYRALQILGNGAIVSALLWGATAAELIDQRPARASLYCFAGATGSLFGIIHSPLPGGALFLPWRLQATEPYHLAVAYAAAGCTLILLAVTNRRRAGR